MLTVMIFVLLPSLLSVTKPVLSAVVFIVCWPFFALAVSQLTDTRTDWPAPTAGVSIRPSTLLPSSRNSVLEGPAFYCPVLIIVAVNVTLSPCFAWLLMSVTLFTIKSDWGAWREIRTFDASVLGSTSDSVATMRDQQL